ncbi:alpha-lytic protease prodomain-containing protein [Cohnella abietis]|uniref:Uncharacterized protein n=1 Tax=Cohnella abietis TaxID=2507935 RepID=A0A3T1D2R8_9BACL|nr:alpha-lytic protease prodomain-containing protein [Cohnella abietis]BBI32402.1 hypothetical protein KCTCHS21_18010 [Cohnella abietis]
MTKVKKIFAAAIVFTLLVGILINSSIEKANASIQNIDDSETQINYIPIEVKDYVKVPDFINKLSPKERERFLLDLELSEQISKLSKSIKDKNIDIGGIYQDNTNRKIVIQVLNDNQKQAIQDLGVSDKYLIYEYVKYSNTDLKKFEASINDAVRSKLIEGVTAYWIDVKENKLVVAVDDYSSEKTLINYVNQDALKLAKISLVTD